MDERLLPLPFAVYDKETASRLRMPNEPTCDSESRKSNESTILRSAETALGPASSTDQQSAYLRLGDLEIARFSIPVVVAVLVVSRCGGSSGEFQVGNATVAS